MFFEGTRPVYFLPGTHIVTSNELTGWSKPKIDDWFTPLSADQCGQLQPSHFVWLKQESDLSVSSRVCVVITSIRMLDDGFHTVNYIQSRSSSGFCRSSDIQESGRLSYLRRPDKVRRFCDKNPLAYNPGDKRARHIDPRFNLPKINF